MRYYSERNPKYALRKLKKGGIGSVLLGSILMGSLFLAPSQLVEASSQNQADSPTSTEDPHLEGEAGREPSENELLQAQSEPAENPANQANLPPSLSQEILNDQDAVVWLDYHKAQIKDAQGQEMRPDRDGALPIEEGMTLELDLSHHPYLNDKSLEFKVEKLQPFTGTEEFNKRIEKYNQENPDHPFTYTQQEQANLSKNMDMWSHAKDPATTPVDEQVVTFRPADPKWSNLYNSLNAIDGKLNENYANIDNVNIPNSVIGSAKEGGNIGLEFSLELKDKVSLEKNPVTMVMADAEEANYSEALIMMTKGEPWQLLSEIGFEGSVGGGHWDPEQPGKKKTWKATPTDANTVDVWEAPKEEAVNAKAQPVKFEPFLEIQYQYIQAHGTPEQKATYTLDVAREHARQGKSKLGDVLSWPQVLEYGKELARKDPRHWVVENGSVYRRYYDTYESRFEGKEVKLNRPASISTPAQVWVNPNPDAGLGTQWFGPVLTAQDYRTVPLVYSNNASGGGVYLTSTGMQTAVIGILSPGAFQEHHIYASLDENGQLIIDETTHGDTTIENYGEQYTTKQKEKPGYSLRAIVSPLNARENGLNSSEAAENAYDFGEDYKEGSYAEDGTETKGWYIPGQKYQVTYLYVKNQETPDPEEPTEPIDPPVETPEDPSPGVPTVPVDPPVEEPDTPGPEVPTDPIDPPAETPEDPSPEVPTEPVEPAVEEPETPGPEEPTDPIDPLVEEPETPGPEEPTNPVDPPVETPEDPSPEVPTEPVEPAVEEPETPGPEEPTDPIDPPVEEPETPGPEEPIDPVEPAVEEPDTPRPEEPTDPIDPSVETPEDPSPEVPTVPVDPPVEEPDTPGPEVPTDPIDPPVETPEDPSPEEPTDPVEPSVEEPETPGPEVPTDPIDPPVDTPEDSSPEESTDPVDPPVEEPVTQDREDSRDKETEKPLDQNSQPQAKKASDSSKKLPKTGVSISGGLLTSLALIGIGSIIGLTGTSKRRR